MSHITSPTPHGVIPPVVTALTTEGRLDVASQEAVCARQLEAGVQGLFVAGTTGEGAFLAREILAEAVRVAIHVAAGQVPVLVGALAPGAAGVIATCHLAETLGAAAIVATTPFYGPVNQAEIARHFRLIAAATALPVVAYSMPGMTHHIIEAEVIEELFSDNIVAGLKDSGHHWEHLAQAIDLGSTYDKPVYVGYEPFAGRALTAGAAGIVASIGNLDPHGVMNVWRAAQAGEPTSAAQDHLDALLAGLDAYSGGDLGPQSALISGIKAGMQRLGVLATREVASPLTRLPDDRLAIVDRQLCAVGLLP
jgi:4-hydroxy-tetrahydrodipicolinate synthase